MKYSTFRSKTCRPSRCSRIARFVSGVIQFRRPISSSGPHGLFETLTPSCSRTRLGDELVTRSLPSCPPSLAGRWPAPRRARRRAPGAGGRRGRSRTRPGREDVLLARRAGSISATTRPPPPRPASASRSPSGSTIWLQPKNSASRSRPTRFAVRRKIRFSAARARVMKSASGRTARASWSDGRRCPPPRARGRASARESAGRSRSRSRSGRAACRRRRPRRRGRRIGRPRGREGASSGSAPTSPPGPTRTAVLRSVSASRSSRPATAWTPSRAQAPASASVAGPGTSWACGEASSAESNM